MQLAGCWCLLQLVSGVNLEEWLPLSSSPRVFVRETGDTLPVYVFVVGVMTKLSVKKSGHVKSRLCGVQPGAKPQVLRFRFRVFGCSSCWGFVLRVRTTSSTRQSAII